MLRLIICFCFVNWSGFSLAPPVAERLAFENPGSPMVVILGPEAALRASLVEWRDALEADPVLDLRVPPPKLITEDKDPGRTLGVWLRSRLRLDVPQEAPLVWVLLGRDGNALMNGTAPPKVDSLVQALENAGEVNPVRQLGAFLKRHPEHAEARRDLILALRNRVILRLQKRPQASSEERILSSEEDELLWGPIARELETLFGGSDWIALEQGLDSFLPPGKPEHLSPRMVALYRKIRPGLINKLMVLPENPYAWTSLLRIEHVLGDGQFIRILKESTFCPWPSKGLPSFVFLPLSKAVRQEARRSGVWSEALNICHESQSN